MDDVLDKLISALKELIESGEEIPDEVLDRVTQLINDEVQYETSLAAPIPSGADLLWILSGENPQAFTQYLQTFPDPALNALAKDPTQLQSVIQRLSRQITQPSGEVEDGIAKSDLNSSNIYGFKYSPRNSRLHVRFNNGSVYEYEGVPPQVFKMFQSGAVAARTNGQNQYGKWWRGKQPSLGAAFYNLIRQGDYPYQKLH